MSLSFRDLVRSLLVFDPVGAKPPDGQQHQCGSDEVKDRASDRCIAQRFGAIGLLQRIGDSTDQQRADAQGSGRIRPRAIPFLPSLTPPRCLLSSGGETKRPPSRGSYSPMMAALGQMGDLPRRIPQA